VRQFGELILHLFPQFAGQERKSLQQSLHIRIGALLGEKAGQLRVSLGKLPSLQPQKAQFVPVKPIQFHRDCTLVGRR
jgi:hypothetical protein